MLGGGTDSWCLVPCRLKSTFLDFILHDSTHVGTRVRLSGHLSASSAIEDFRTSLLARRCEMLRRGLINKLNLKILAVTEAHDLKSNKHSRSLKSSEIEVHLGAVVEHLARKCVRWPYKPRAWDSKRCKAGPVWGSVPAPMRRPRCARRWPGIPCRGRPPSLKF